MAEEIRPPGAAVSRAGLRLDETLFRTGYRFDFFQAVRLLERLYTDRDQPRTHTSRTPVGRHTHPRDEVVRIRQRQSLQFPPSEIYEVTPPEPGDKDPRDVLWTNVIGLCGVSGPMPRHYAQLLAESVPPPAREADQATAGGRPRVEAPEDERLAPPATDLPVDFDMFTQRVPPKQARAMHDFFDVFNHRIASLFYRAWEKYRFPIAYERGGDSFSHYLYCLIGLGTHGLHGRMHIDEQILLFYTGLLAQRPRSAIALEGMLEDYFGVPIRVVQFQGEWFEMNADLLSSLGGDGQNNQLGVSTVLWDRIFDPPARFRIVVGPLDYDTFKHFLPGFSGYVHMVELARFFVGEDVNFDVQPTLRREEVPYCELQRPDGDRSVRLGWSMWLKDREFEEDVPQPVFAGRLAEA